MTNKKSILITNILKSAFVLFIIFSLSIISFFAYAQESPPAQAAETQEKLPYELGVVLVQYDEDTFQPQVNESENLGPVKVPGGLLDNTDGPIAPIAVVDNLLTEKGYTPQVIEQFPDLNTEAIRIGEDTDPLSVMDSLIDLPGVVLVQPNLIYTTDTTDQPSESAPAFNDPDLSTSWHLIHTQVYDTDADEEETAWKVLEESNSGYLPTIAFIDDGISPDHPEFKDVTGYRPQFNRLPNLSHCNLPVFSNGIETDSAKSTSTTCPMGGYNFSNNSNDVRHDKAYPSSHGTGVAGVAAANRDNEFGGAGVAPSVTIMPIHNNIKDTLSFLKSVAFARLNGADVINTSFGSRHSTIPCTALYRSDYPARPKNLLEHQQIGNFPGLFVAAAGNRNRKISDGNAIFVVPADFNTDMTDQGCWSALPNVISVGGTEKGKDLNGDGTVRSVEESTIAAQGIDEVRWDANRHHGLLGSNHSPSIDIAAPAHSILVPTVKTVDGKEVYGTQTVSGTSVATPQIAGVLALMLQANKNLTTAQLKQRLLESADELISLTGPDCTVGTNDDYVHRGRRVNAYNAVQAALGLPYTKKEVSDLTDEQRRSCVQGGSDVDGDGLIDISTLGQLYNMRHNLAGTSYKTSETDQGVTTGCPSTGCYGYELLHDIDFRGSEFTDGRWVPIDGFSGTFQGHDYSVHNLSSSRSSSSGHTIFGTLASGAQIGDPIFINDTYWGCDPGAVASCNLPSTNHLSTSSGTCSADLDDSTKSCSYRCERGLWVEVKNTCSQTHTCVTDLKALSDGTVTRNGSLASGCESTARGRTYAHYYTFTINGRKKVTIDMTRARDINVDPYLYLRNHTSANRNRSGDLIVSDDNGLTFLGGARIIRTLSPGTYTIEATSARPTQTGAYTMSVTAASVTVSTCPEDTNHIWIVDGNTCSASLPATAVNTSQTITDKTGASSGSITYQCDVNGYRTITDATCTNTTVTCPAADYVWTGDDTTCRGSVRTTPAGASRTVIDRSMPVIGSVTYQCGTDGSWTQIGDSLCGIAACPVWNPSSAPSS